MVSQFSAVYENGVLRPLDPIALPEHQRLSVTVHDAGTTTEDWLDHEAVALASREADESIGLEDIRRALSKIPGSMAAAVIAEREER